MLNPLWLLFSIIVWLKKTTSLPKLYFKMLTAHEIPQCLQNVLKLLKKTLNATVKEQGKSFKVLISMLQSATVNSFNSNNDLQKTINECDKNIQNLMKNLSCGNEEMAKVMLQLNLGRFHFIKTFYTEEKRRLY